MHFIHDIVPKILWGAQGKRRGPRVRMVIVSVDSAGEMDINSVKLIYWNAEYLFVKQIY